MNINFSEVFKKLRRERELTQEQAAEAFSVSTQAVNRWERRITAAKRKQRTGNSAKNKCEPLGLCLLFLFWCDIMVK